jgi:uncharacterized membrane protein (UPF0127 family)
VATGRVQAIVGGDGRVVCEYCSLADSFLSRLRGLLGRRELRSGEGLLLSSGSSVHTCFMRFPIDAVFLDRGLRVVGVSEHVRPWRLAGRKGASRVLELPAGESSRRAVRTGEQLVVIEPAGGRGMTAPRAELEPREAGEGAPEITIALLARDRRFLRVTSFLLARHGYAVHTTHTPRSLIELLEQTGADVVVVDGSDPSNVGARAAALVATLERPRGLVVVDENADARPLRAPAAVAKWTSFESLRDAIDREYRRTQATNGASHAR